MSGTPHDHENTLSGGGPSIRRLGADFESDLQCALGSTAPVLITGPAELTAVIAARIHREGIGRGGAFLTLDCGRTRSIDQLEVAFAAAAPRGTLFLRDVDRLAPPLQALLSFRIAPLAIRVIAGTSRSLLHATVEGSFDERLFYRLNQIHLVASVGGQPTGAA